MAITISWLRVNNKKEKENDEPKLKVAKTCKGSDETHKDVWLNERSILNNNQRWNWRWSVKNHGKKIIMYHDMPSSHKMSGQWTTLIVNFNESQCLVLLQSFAC